MKWDDEYTLVVSDWYHDQHIDLLAEFMDWRNPTGAEPVPGELTFYVKYGQQVNELTSLDSAAIYVLHKEQYLPSAEAIRTGEGVNDNASLRFEAGRTYKIRIINMSALASEFFRHALVTAEKTCLIRSSSVLYRTGPARNLYHRNRRYRSRALQTRYPDYLGRSTILDPRHSQERDRPELRSERNASRRHVSSSPSTRMVRKWS